MGLLDSVGGHSIVEWDLFLWQLSRRKQVSYIGVDFAGFLLSCMAYGWCA
jgi:hypothetical protein